MSDRDVSAIFTGIYNGFWMKHRNNLPDLSDEAGWDAICEEGMNLMKKYDCQLATDLVADLMAIMDQRARKRVRS